jgi:hypothetical protein
LIPALEDTKVYDRYGMFYIRGADGPRNVALGQRQQTNRSKAAPNFCKAGIIGAPAIQARCIASISPFESR